MKKIQVLGTGCPKCRQLAELAVQTAEELGIQYELQKITQLSDIMEFGVMVTPALAVDGVVKCTGRVPNASQIREMLAS